LALDVIVLGGGLTDDPDLFFHPLQEMLKESMPFPGIKNTPIVKSNLGNESNLWCTCTLYIKEN
jgi:hypothetical protein